MTDIALNLPFGDLSALFAAEGLPEPPLPAEMVRSMRAHGPTAFVSDELIGDWHAGTAPREAALRWLEDGTAQRGAWGELIVRGFHSSYVQIGLETPRFAIFVRKLTSETFEDAAANRRRVLGSFNLMKRLLDAIAAASMWPAGKRLVFVDADEDGAPYWAWVAEHGAQWSDLKPDAMGWITALLSVEALVAPPASLTVNATSLDAARQKGLSESI
jgi:hypothetical protein